MELENLLEHFFNNSLEKIIISSEEKNIEQRYDIEELPNKYLSKEVIDWSYEGNGILFASI